MRKNFGFTLIELLAVLVILVLILAIAIPVVSNVIKKSTISSFESDAKMVLKAIEYRKLEDENFNPLTITKDNLKAELKIADENYSQVSFTMVGNQVKIVLIGTGKFDGLTAYGTFKKMNVTESVDYAKVVPTITITGDNPLTIDTGVPYADQGATAADLEDGNLTSNIVTSGSVNTEIAGTYVITYNVSDSDANATTVTRTVNVVKAGNAPVLATGMTPIKWDGSAWVNTTADDTDWYNYNTTDKKWANAKTTDGSMWVWIPRYIYKITSGWHSSTTGTIDVRFSSGTDDTRGGTITLDTGTTSNASNNKWTNHPAFTFGTTELTGIWVAKFEASGTPTTVDFKPNVVALTNLIVGDMFTAARNLETNSRYGWGTTGTGIDTHMMKNSEWGAIAYLSKSPYGQNTNEIWINPADNYTTGCAGDSVSAASTTGCLRAYNTTNGVKASSTGTIYGIYDMSGGSYEYVAAYVNNGHVHITTYANSVVSAAAKYKDIYTMGAVDDPASNYDLAINKKGDAVYETSSSGAGSTSWHSDYSNIPYIGMMWFARSGSRSNTTNGGAFLYNALYAGTNPGAGFRSVILVGTGL